ncbi:MAG: metallophosphoesterase [Clostridia bacterium]|nr:metallophosphoesterase [Clostridia bacterium]
MSVFVIADTHLSFAANKPMDIFPGWQNYVSRLENNWNRLVTSADTVVIPGDISWGMTLTEAAPDLQFLHKLNGKKILLKGNHDYWWTSMKKLADMKAQNGLDSISFVYNNAAAAENIAVCGTRGWMPDAGDDDKVLRREAGRLRASLEAAKQTGLEPVVFLHYPPIYDNSVCEEIYNILLEYKIRRCYFGHLHYERTGKFRRVERDGIVFSLVSADSLDFTPKPVARDGIIF